MRRSAMGCLFFYLICCMNVVAGPRYLKAVFYDGVIQTDDAVVAVGSVRKQSGNSIVVARYTADGFSDLTFGSSGVTVTSIGTQAEARAILLQGDGKIICAGWAEIGGNNHLALARYDSSGGLDTSFGQSGTGIVTNSFGSQAKGHSALLQADGKIVIVGVDGSGYVFVTRYTSGGILDTAFGTSGITNTLVPGYVGLSSVLQSDEKIVVVANDELSAALMRFNTDGSLDTEFGTSGITTIALSTDRTYGDHVYAVGMTSDGKIMVAGYTALDALLMRYTSTGALDITFNETGIVTTTIATAARIHGMYIPNDDSVVVCGRKDNALVLGKYGSDGVADTTFGSESTGFDLVLRPSYAQAHKVCVNSDGELIVIGQDEANGIVIRYTAAGLIDNTFATNGLASYPESELIAKTPSVASVWEQKGLGVNAGAFNSGGWQTRALNTLSGDSSFVSLSSNQFTLQPGSYELRISAPAYRVANHQVRLYNETDAAVVQYGTSECAPTSVNSSMTNSTLTLRISMNTAKTFSIQHQATQTKGGDGMGTASGFGNEIYAKVTIVRL